MAIFTLDGLYEATSQTWRFGPFAAIGFTFASLVVAFTYAMFLELDSAYVKAPKHFPKRGRIVTFQKPKTKAPLVELNADGDYREALERGSRLVGFCSDQQLCIWSRTFDANTGALESRQAVSYPSSSKRMGHHSIQMIDQIKNLPESKLSFQQGSYDFFMGWHTGITNHERAVANILKGGVDKIIDAVYAVVQDESSRTVLQNIGPCEGMLVSMWIDCR